MTGAAAIIEFYETLGFDSIPLKPGGKEAIRGGWQSKAPDQLWRNVDRTANIGLRGGGAANLAVIDCDNKNDPQTYSNAAQFMLSRGYCLGDYPIIQTASEIGKHFYVRFTGNWEGSSVNLSPEFGAGEFRFGSGAYVVAPPSVVNGNEYKIILGDLLYIPTLAADDISNIVKHTPKTKTTTPGNSDLPASALRILSGKTLEKYTSRSEAEAALMAILINAGQPYERILKLFQNHQCAGKFHELYNDKPSNALRWFDTVYHSCLQFCAKDSPARQTAARAIEWANSHPWIGRTGSTDKLVFIAHAKIAYRCGRKHYSASSRTLAELAGIGWKTAARSTKRLCNANLIKRITECTVDSPAIYELYVSSCPHFLKICREVGHYETSNGENNNKEVGHYETLANSDVFRRMGLGKAAHEVYRALYSKELSVSELVNITGRGRVTVWRVLKKMSKIIDSHTGEILAMVEREGDKWRALPVDLDAVAMCLGTAGMGKKQREKHQAERRTHRRSLLRGSHEIVTMTSRNVTVTVNDSQGQVNDI